MKKILEGIFILILGAALSSGVLSTARAHRFHTSLTRIDYNSEKKLFEISIQLFTHDLVPLLEEKTGGTVDLEKKSDVDKTILSYLNENFVLIDKEGGVKKLSWFGKEADVDTVWVYVETASPEGLEGYSLQNTMFFEKFPEQTNLVVCRYSGNKADLIFRAGDKIKKIVSAKLPD